MRRYRVKVRGAHTDVEYVVEADSRDDAWLHVADHRDELEPDRSREYPAGVYWASIDEGEAP